MKEQQAVSALQDSLKENGIETRKMPRAAALRVSFMGAYHRVTYAGEGKGWLVNGYNEAGDPVKISELQALCEELSAPVAEEAAPELEPAQAEDSGNDEAAPNPEPTPGEETEIFTPGEEIEKDAIGIPTPGEEVEIFTPGEEVERDAIGFEIEKIKLIARINGRATKLRVSGEDVCLRVVGKSLIQSTLEELQLVWERVDLLTRDEVSKHSEAIALAKAGEESEEAIGQFYEFGPDGQINEGRDLQTFLSETSLEDFFPGCVVEVEESAIATPELINQILSLSSQLGAEAVCTEKGVYRELTSLALPDCSISELHFILGRLTELSQFVGTDDSEPIPEEALSEDERKANAFGAQFVKNFLCDDAIAPPGEEIEEAIALNLNPEPVQRRHYIKWIHKLSNLSNVAVLPHEAEFLKDPEECPLADLKKIIDRLLRPTAEVTR
ncbi:hypothetical protein [Laspinema olomoucense]|uniref:hypothetical protein n=1 Tax=Laspinema olomoucense TaxID=3231600 RepID=UPI0021BBA6C3|nr:hypothetical protein [Laspinema sp. D3a]MCT7987629.1 hypothetical protein [Laspinema sp. D3a]